MFIVKLVCDKCGTQANTEDKFCRECGTKGVPDTSKKVIDEESFKKLKEDYEKATRVRCRTCGELYPHDKVHVCKGLIQKQPHQPSKFYGDGISWVDTSYPALGKICTNEIKVALL